MGAPAGRPDSAQPSGAAITVGRIVVVAVFLALALLIALAAVADSKHGIGGLLRFREDGRGVEAYGLVLLAFSVLVVSGMAGVLVSGGSDRRLLLGAVAAAKLVLLLAVIFMFAFPHLSQFEGKSLTYRAILYPTLAMAPALQWLRRGRRDAFPWVFDGFLTFALAFDIVSNDLHYYGTWLHWDDGVHYANSVPILILMTLALLAIEAHGKFRLGFGWGFFFAFCAYTSLHALWEMEEFALDKFLGTNLQPGGMEEASRNNLAGLAGGLTALPVLWLWNRSGALSQCGAAPLAGLFGRKPTSEPR